MPKLPTLTKEHLVALIRQFKEFPEEHRDNCWRFLLALPCNEERFIDLENAFKVSTHEGEEENERQIYDIASNLTFTLDKAYPISSETLKNRIHKVSLALYRWSPNLAECPWLPKFIFPFVKFYGVSTVSAFETCCVLLKTFEQFFIFRNFTSNRELFIINEILCEYFLLKQMKCKKDEEIDVVAEMKRFFDQNAENLPLKDLKSEEFFLFNTFSSFFTELLEGDDWLKLMDHIFCNNKILFVYILLAVFTAREMDLCFKILVDEKFLNLKKIDDCLRCAYLIYNSFNERETIDVYGDLGRIETGNFFKVFCYDEFEKDFPTAELVDIEFNQLPESISMPDMRIRDTKQEAEDIAELFNEKRGERLEVQKQEERLEDQLERASEILERSRNGGNSLSEAQIDEKIRESGLLGSTKQLPEVQERNGNVSSANPEPVVPENVALSEGETVVERSLDLDKVQENIKNEELGQPAPPKRFATVADEDLKADELVAPERPLTTAEIRRNVAKSEAVQEKDEADTLQKKLQAIERDYAERRAGKAQQSKKYAKAEITGGSAWGERIGSSVGSAIQQKMRPIRVSKTQSGVEHDSSQYVSSRDGVAAEDDLYRENSEERAIVEGLPEKPVKMASTDIKQIEKADRIAETAIQSENAFRQGAAEGASQSATNTTKSSEFSSKSQKTPSIIKSNSTSKGSAASKNGNNECEEEKQPKRDLKLNENVKPAASNRDIVDRLISKHRQELKQTGEGTQRRPGQKSEEAVDNARQDVESPLVAQKSESSLLSGNIEEDGIDISKEEEHHVSGKEGLPSDERGSQQDADGESDKRSQSQPPPEGDITNEVSRPTGYEEKLDKMALEYANQSPSQLKKEQINNLPVSLEVKQKLYDLQSLSSDNEQPLDVKEIATAQNELYLDILNNDQISVDEKINNLIKQIKENNKEVQERIKQQKIVDKLIEHDAEQDSDDQNAQTVQRIPLDQQPVGKPQQNAFEQNNNVYEDHPENIIISSLTQSSESEIQKKNEIADLLNERKLQDNQLAHSDSSEMSQKPIRTAATVEHNLPTQEELVEQVGRAPQIVKIPNYLDDSGSSIMTPQKVIQQEYVLEQQEKEQNLEILSDMGGGSLPRPGESRSSAGAAVGVGRQHESDRSSLTDEVHQKAIDDIIQQFSQPAGQGQRPGANASSGTTTGTALPLPSSSSAKTGAARNPPGSSAADSANSNLTNSLLDDRANEQLANNSSSSLLNSDKSSDRVDAILAQYRQSDNLPKPSSSSSEKSQQGQLTQAQLDQRQRAVEQQGPPAENYPASDTHTQSSISAPSTTAQQGQAAQRVLQSNSAQQMSQISAIKNLLPRPLKPDESVISAVNESKTENYFSKPQVHEASSSFDDLDYQAAKYGVKPQKSQLGETAGGETHASMSETSQSNFSEYLRLLQQQTKALEERLEVSTKPADISKISVTSGRPKDVEIYSTGASTSTFDSDPESFVESAKMAVLAAKNLREDTESARNGLAGIFTEVKKDLAAIESQISSSQ